MVGAAIPSLSVFEQHIQIGILHSMSEFLPTRDIQKYPYTTARQPVMLAKNQNRIICR